MNVHRYLALFAMPQAGNWSNAVWCDAALNMDFQTAGHLELVAPA
jgi:hypothetical protein